MRTTIFIIIGVIVVAAVLIWGFSTHWGRKSVYSAPTSSPTTTEGTSPIMTSPVSGQANITINNFAFTPQTLMITKGTKVTWKNDQNVDHQVMSDTGVFKSNPIPSGSTFDFTFNNAGTFPYHCNIHPTMTGTIIVQ